MDIQTINHNLQIARSLAEPYYQKGNKKMGIKIIQLASSIALRQLDELKEKEELEQDLDYLEALDLDRQENEATGN